MPIPIPMLRSFVIVAMGLGLVVSTPAVAQDNFPSRPVRIVVPFPPGGATDITARVIGEKLVSKWGQQVLIDNRAGAGGNIGSELVAKAPPDGYTMVLGVTGSHGINVSLYKKMPYHPLRDFECVTQATLYPNAIVVHPSVPANNLQELIALAMKEPGKLSYGSDGNGTASHLGMELLKANRGFNITHIPYKGSSPMLTDLAGGQLQVGITGLPAVMPFVKSGKLKVLAVTTAERSPGAPEIPTVAEQGNPGFAAAPWSGFFVPKGTPKALVDRLATDMIAVMQMPDVKQRMTDLGSALVASKPEEFRAFLVREIETWAEAVKVSGATVD